MSSERSGSSFESFLEEAGIKDEVYEAAQARVETWQASITAANYAENVDKLLAAMIETLDFALDNPYPALDVIECEELVQLAHDCRKVYTSSGDDSMLCEIFERYKAVLKPE